MRLLALHLVLLAKCSILRWPISGGFDDEHADFFRSRLDQMIDLRHPLAVLATRLPWAEIEAARGAEVRPDKTRALSGFAGEYLAGASTCELGGGVSNAGRPRLPIRFMASLLYLKNSFNLSDEELVERWTENVHWQFFSGFDYSSRACRATPRRSAASRRLLGEEGLEQLLKSTIRLRRPHQGRSSPPNSSA